MSDDCLRDPSTWILAAGARGGPASGSTGSARGGSCPRRAATAGIVSPRPLPTTYEPTVIQPWSAHQAPNDAQPGAGGAGHTLSPTSGHPPPAPLPRYEYRCRAVATTFALSTAPRRQASLATAPDRRHGPAGLRRTWPPPTGPTCGSGYRPAGARGRRLVRLRRRPLRRAAAPLKANNGNQVYDVPAGRRPGRADQRDDLVQAFSSRSLRRSCAPVTQRSRPVT